ncbi:hypothetical protein [Streptomyces sp. NPDC056669]|uniref:hypothetical protein n=2 Tax=unclassified Streptomyces TaxID=2593676 RepID=UPI0036921248
MRENCAVHGEAMLSSRLCRWLKGIVVSAAAAHATYWVWESAEQWESEAQRANPDGGIGTGFIEGALATFAWLTLVPLLLWSGMRLLRERDNHLLVTMGSAAWIILGTQMTKGGVSRVETELFLLAFTLLGGFLALFRPTAPEE